MNEWQISHVSPLNLLSQLLDLKTKNNLNKIIHFHGSFGDIYCQLSVYAESINNLGNLLLIDIKYKELVLYVKNENDCIIFIDSAMLNNQFSKLDILGNDTTLPIRLLPTLYPMVPELMSNLELKYSAFLRLLLDSSEKNHFKQIEIRENTYEQVKNIFNDLDLPKGKTIIFSPDNNTQQIFSNEFWNDFLRFIEELKWTPVLNNSGNLSYSESKFVFNSKIKKIKIPPHLAVSITEFAGAYIGGTNGFQTIQALFNKTSIGIHIINISSLSEGNLLDNFGNRINLNTFIHENSFKNEFLKIQKEIKCYDKFDNYIKDKLYEILK